VTPVGAEPADTQTADRQPRPAVVLDDVRVALGGATVLDGLGLIIERGTIVGIGGDNGAGKSTLLRLIAGLVEPDRGAIDVLGADPASPTVRSRVGCAIDTPSAYSWMSARGHLRTVQLMGGADDRREVDDLLRRFGLGAVGRKRVFRFSQGMKKRLALAQAALGEPEVLLLDEPTNALDPSGRDEVWAWLAAERSRGTTTVLVSHRDADRHPCDRWLHLDEGRLRGA